MARDSFGKAAAGSATLLALAVALASTALTSPALAQDAGMDGTDSPVIAPYAGTRIR